MWQLNYFSTKAPKQIIYNYAIIIPWKFGELLNKMSHYKIKGLHYNCKLVTRWTPIHYNVHNINIIVVNHV
jgi:hypothetical protein